MLPLSERSIPYVFIARRMTFAPGLKGVSSKAALSRKRTPYGGALELALFGDPACEAGCTYVRLLMWSLCKMKRSACLTAPAATSSAVGRSAAMGNPAAPAGVHGTPRKFLRCALVRTQR